MGKSTPMNLEHYYDLVKYLGEGVIQEKANKWREDYYYLHEENSN